MVEGHGVHRTAKANQRLIGQTFTASSPNGRFEEGAEKITKTHKHVTKVEAIGKNLFLWFHTTPKHSPGKDSMVVHIHFGMSGQFATYNKGSEPDAKPTTRLVLHGDKTTSMVSCQTLDHGDESFFQQWQEKLGPDPLREDADSERFWNTVQKSKKPIGLLLMTQEAIAGIGNIYRAEILFKCRIHPLQPSHTLTKEEFDVLWKHSVECLQRGFSSGSILTVDEADAKKLGAPWTRRYIYNHEKCGFCKNGIKSFDMAGRNCYVCDTCQPLKHEVTSKGKKKHADAKQVKEFVSHCAREGPETLTPSKMTVSQLKEKLATFGLSQTGNKKSLEARLREVLDEGKQEKVQDEVEANIETKVQTQDTKRVITGTQALKMATAKEAAMEKKKAGEKRNVEHIALIDQLELEEIEVIQKRPKRARKPATSKN